VPPKGPGPADQPAVALLDEDMHVFKDLMKDKAAVAEIAQRDRHRPNWPARSKSTRPS